MSSSKRSSRSICRKRPSSGGSCIGSRPCSGGFAGRPRSRPACCGCRARFSTPSRVLAKTQSLAGEGTPRAFDGTGPEFGLDVVSGANGEQQLHPGGSRAASASRDIALSFLRLANLDSEIADRLSRYEAALWRQLAQTLFALQALKHR